MSNWHEKAVEWLLNPKKSLLWLVAVFILCCWYLGHQLSVVATEAVKQIEQRDTRAPASADREGGE